MAWHLAGTRTQPLSRLMLTKWSVDPAEEIGDGNINIPAKYFFPTPDFVIFKPLSPSDAYMNAQTCL